ncbi:M14 family zinc carboxypeptidase [Bacillus sp. T3]|uniref:M14 family zinc carboxypeptidase n=1 Tax=Bacillus sp. T3 TaxID=467262 RepID=UPI002980B60F|nr:M14 family zinc carboxypeptidase [Bacillus sp. T3]
MRKKISIFFVGLVLFLAPSIGFAQHIKHNNDYTYEQLEKDLNTLKRKYPEAISIQKIGLSELGRNIWAVKLGKGKRGILLIGTHHGREWLTTMLLMTMMEKYAAGYQQNEAFGPYSTRIFDDIAIWFVPMLNPDGVEIQQKGLGGVPNKMQDNIFEMNGYSPDFTKWKANGVGVDLNRQYPAGWRELRGVPFPWYQFYKGKAPIQASEIKAITSFTMKVSPMIAVSYHSSGREIFWNFQNGSQVQRDQYFAEKVSLLTGYKLGMPEENAVGAGFTDWFITTFHKPGMTIEICPLVEETSPPLSSFQEEWTRNKLVGLMLAVEAKKRIP